MAYNTRSIKKDVDGRPIPQYFNQMTDNYEPLLGENGAARSVLYGPDGQPISSSNRLPVDVGGAVDISDRADRRLGQVTLSGSNVQPTVRIVTETPLAAGGSYTDSIIDLTQAPGIGLVGYVVASDTPTRVRILFGDGVETPDPLRPQVDITLYPRTASGRAQVIPPFRPTGRTMRVVIDNPSPTAQTILRVYELRYNAAHAFAQNVRAVLAYNLAIRDTITHHRSSDPQYVFRLVRTALGGGKVPIYIQNGLDQAVTVTVNIAVSDVMSASLGTVTVPAASNRVITNQDFPGLDVPSEEVNLIFQCSTAPTAGVINAYIDTLVGGTG